MDALLMLASAAEGEAEPSKTAFYIAGGITTVFAVLVSIVGLRQPNFPDGKAQQAGVTALAVLVVVGAMATMLITA